MWPRFLNMYRYTVLISLSVQCLLLWCSIDYIQSIIGHKWPHYFNLEQLLAKFRQIISIKACLDLYLGQEELSLSGNIIIGALNKLSLRAHVHLLCDERCHLVYIIYWMLACPVTHLNLVLPEKNLQSYILDSLSVEAFNLSNQLLFPLLDLVED